MGLRLSATNSLRKSERTEMDQHSFEIFVDFQKNVHQSYPFFG